MAPTGQYIVVTTENLRGFMLSGPGRRRAKGPAIEGARRAVGAWKLSDETVDKAGKVQ